MAVRIEGVEADLKEVMEEFFNIVRDSTPRGYRPIFTLDRFERWAKNRVDYSRIELFSTLTNLIKEARIELYPGAEGGLAFRILSS